MYNTSAASVMLPEHHDIIRQGGENVFTFLGVKALQKREHISAPPRHTLHCTVQLSNASAEPNYQARKKNYKKIRKTKRKHSNPSDQCVDVQCACVCVSCNTVLLPYCPPTVLVSDATIATPLCYHRLNTKPLPPFQKPQHFASLTSLNSLK